MPVLPLLVTGSRSWDAAGDIIEHAIDDDPGPSPRRRGLGAGASHRAGCAAPALAAFWPHKAAQRRHLLRIAEQHYTSSSGVWAGSGCACISLRIRNSKALNAF